MPSDGEDKVEDDNVDETIDEPQDYTFPTVIAIGENSSTFYSIKIASNSDSFELKNLSNELELSESSTNSIISLDNGIFTYGNTIFDNSEQIYKAKIEQKNIITEETFGLSGFCAPNLGVNFNAPKGSIDYLSFYYINSITDSEESLILKSWNKIVQSCSEFSLGNGEFMSSSQFENYFLGYRIRQVYNPQLTFIRELWLADLEISQEPISYQVDDSFNFATVNSNKLFIFYENGNYEVYDIDSNNLLIESNNNVFSEFNGNGVFKTTFFDGQMLFYVPDEQTVPPLPFKPILFDTENNIVTNFNIDYQKLNNHTIDKYDALGTVLNFTLDYENSLMLIGYGFSGQETGLILYCNLDGTILKEVELPYAPIYINVIN